MQTFKFDELSGRAKMAAILRYGEEQAVEEEAANMMENGTPLAELEDSGHVFDSLGWRFTEHGERIA